MTFDIRQYILEQNDVREGLWDKVKGAALSGVNVVKDSEGRTGKVIKADKTHATVRWEDGKTDKIGFVELDRKDGVWFWQI